MPPGLLRCPVLVPATSNCLPLDCSGRVGGRAAFRFALLLCTCRLIRVVSAQLAPFRLVLVLLLERRFAQPFRQTWSGLVQLDGPVASSTGSRRGKRGQSRAGRALSIPRAAPEKQAQRSELGREEQLRRVAVATVTPVRYSYLRTEADCGLRRALTNEGGSTHGADRDRRRWMPISERAERAKAIAFGGV